MAKIGDVIDAENARWTFANKTRTQFEQHIEKSVPFYNEGHKLALGLSDFFLTKNSVCYDIGCSTATLLKNLDSHHEDKGIQFYGVESEKDMVTIAREKCKNNKKISIIDDSIENIELLKTDLVVSYYTMQFISPRYRQDAFDKIYQALNWGGAFLLFEKVRSPDARFQDIISSLYTDYKLTQGYSGDEIISKSRSLKSVLEPFSHSGNMGLLERAGFKDVTSVFKYLCFEGFLAIK
jgi:tRNA (cmo5U34)-methyltransferase